MFLRKPVISALTIGGILGEKRTQDTALSSSQCRVVICINEGRNTKNVREENELLPNGCAILAHTRQELDRVHPFLCSNAEYIK
jgi:hypothetical protein